MACTCEAEGTVSAQWSSSALRWRPAQAECRIFSKGGMNVNGRLHGLLATLCRSDGSPPPPCGDTWGRTFHHSFPGLSKTSWHDSRQFVPTVHVNVRRLVRENAVRRTAVCFDTGGSRFKHLPQPRGSHLILLPFHGGMYVEINTYLATGYVVQHCRTI